MTPSDSHDENDLILEVMRDTRPDVPPLDEFTRARILREARNTRLRRRLAPLAAAAAIVALLVSPFGFDRAPEMAAPGNVAMQPAIRTDLVDFDPVLAELDLLDLQLQEILDVDWLAAGNGNAGELYEFHSMEDSI